MGKTNIQVLGRPRTNLKFKRLKAGLKSVLLSQAPDRARAGEREQFRKKVRRVCGGRAMLKLKLVFISSQYVRTLL